MNHPRKPRELGPSRRRCWCRRSSFAAWALLSLWSCASPERREGRASDLGVEAKLARVGLERIREEDAAIPPGERGRYVPCRVVVAPAGEAAGASSLPLPAHAAGYLLVGVAGEGATGAGAILAALSAWQPGEFLTLRVRRNPYLEPSAEWWERDVTIWLPGSK